MEEFRDKIGNVSKKGKREWIFPKKPVGTFYNYRTVVSILLLAILFGMPFIKIDGHPLMLFNILERKFIVFGMMFAPQDFYLFVLAMITLIVFIILFTVIFGRIFCGWICPQTIFLEMVFRKIEYWIEGDYHKQKALAKSPWTLSKTIKKFSKHVLFFSISFLIANTFLAYIIGVDELYNIVTVPPSEHLTGFIAIVLFSLAFYTIFAFVREYVCIFACPYGRLQGVLLDKNSIVIAYDYNRGEPRSFINKSEERNAGDCIDCKQCVDVCPTGIDIRNGTQLECVNCTACIDACDNIMDKVGFERGLIRYASSTSISENKSFKINSRIIGYTSVLILLLSVFTFLFLNKSDVSATVLRTPGMFYQQQPDGRTSNVYNLKIINKSFEKKEVEIRTTDEKAELNIFGEANIILEPQEIREVKFLIIKEKDPQRAYITQVNIGIFSNGELLKEVETSFMSPVIKEESK